MDISCIIKLRAYRNLDQSPKVCIEQNGSSLFLILYMQFANIFIQVVKVVYKDWVVSILKLDMLSKFV